MSESKGAPAGQSERGELLSAWGEEGRELLVLARARAAAKPAAESGAKPVSVEFSLQDELEPFEPSAAKPAPKPRR